MLRSKDINFQQSNELEAAPKYFWENFCDCLYILSVIESSLDVPLEGSGLKGADKASP